MEEIINTFKAALFERASNHLTRCFAIAWIIHNYKFFLVIFSDESIRFKLVEIDEIFSPFEISTLEIPGAIFHGILIPLIYAVLYIFIYSKLSKPFIKYHEETLTTFRNTKAEAQKGRLITPEKYAELIMLFREAESNFHQKIDTLNTEIRELQKLVLSKKTNSSTKNISGEVKTKITSLSQEDIDVLKAHQDLHEGAGQTLKTLIENTGLGVDEVKLSIDNLLKSGFITLTDVSDDYENIYTITPTGIKYLRDIN